MPTIHTQSGNVVFGAGKSAGQIAGERESYVRGVEQARLDMHKQQMDEARKIRELARIDADEKETRRQLEWEAIAKRSAEAVEESKRRFGITQEGIQERWEGLSGGEKATQERLKTTEQIRTGQWEQTFKRLEDTARTSKEQWGKTEGRQKEQWAKTHELDIQKLEETKKYRETLNKLKEIASQQKATQEIAKAERAGKKEKLSLAKTILSKPIGDSSYPKAAYEWADKVMLEFTSGAGATTDVLGIR